MLFGKDIWSSFEERYSVYSSNETDEDGSCVVEIDVPGANKNDVDIDVVGNTLKINVTPSYGRKKRTFYKEFLIGKEFNSDELSAKISDGILTITLPLLKEKSGKKVKVT